jgi:hypothetical protein
MREYRARTRRKEPSYSYSPDRKQLRNARAYVAVMIERGKIAPKLCEDCSKTGFPHFPDPTKPREVVWLCRGHRTLRRQLEERERRDIAAQASAAVRKVKWAELKAQFDSEWPTLNNEEREYVANLSLRNPLMKDIPPESPLARQALVKAFGDWRNGAR